MRNKFFKTVSLFLFFFSNLQAQNSGKKILQDQCDKNNYGSCYWLARNHFYSKEMDQALKLLKKSCDNKHPEACLFLAAINLKQKKLPDVERYISSACDNNLDACMKLAGDKIEKRGLLPSEMEQFHHYLFQSICKKTPHSMNQKIFCFPKEDKKKCGNTEPIAQNPNRIASLKNINDGNSFLNQNKPDQALPLFLKTCDHDPSLIYLESCYEVAKIYQKKNSLVLAHKYFLKVCENIKTPAVQTTTTANHYQSCISSALLFHELGDPKNGNKMLQRTCEQNSSFCAEFGKSLERKGDLKNSRLIFSMLCDHVLGSNNLINCETD